MGCASSAPIVPPGGVVSPQAPPYELNPPTEMAATAEESVTDKIKSTMGNMTQDTVSQLVGGAMQIKEEAMSKIHDFGESMKDTLESVVDEVEDKLEATFGSIDSKSHQKMEEEMEEVNKAMDDMADTIDDAKESIEEKKDEMIDDMEKELDTMVEDLEESLPRAPTATPPRVLSPSKDESPKTDFQMELNDKRPQSQRSVSRPLPDGHHQIITGEITADEQQDRLEKINKLREDIETPFPISSPEDMPNPRKEIKYPVSVTPKLDTTVPLDRSLFDSTESGYSKSTGNSGGQEITLENNIHSQREELSKAKPETISTGNKEQEIISNSSNQVLNDSPQSVKQNSVKLPEDENKTTPLSSSKLSMETNKDENNVCMSSLSEIQKSGKEIEELKNFKATSPKSLPELETLDLKNNSLYSEQNIETNILQNDKSIFSNSVNGEINDINASNNIPYPESQKTTNSKKVIDLFSRSASQISANSNNHHTNPIESQQFMETNILQNDENILPRSGSGKINNSIKNTSNELSHSESQKSTDSKKLTDSCSRLTSQMSVDSNNHQTNAIETQGTVETSILQNHKNISPRPGSGSINNPITDTSNKLSRPESKKSTNSKKLTDSFSRLTSEISDDSNNPQTNPIESIQSQQKQGVSRPGSKHSKSENVLPSVQQDEYYNNEISKENISSLSRPQSNTYKHNAESETKHTDMSPFSNEKSVTNITVQQVNGQAHSAIPNADVQLNEHSHTPIQNANVLEAEVHPSSSTIEITEGNQPLLINNNKLSMSNNYINEEQVISDKIPVIEEQNLTISSETDQQKLDKQTPVQELIGVT